jgi:hypothetical protein
MQGWPIPNVFIEIIKQMQLYNEIFIIGKVIHVLGGRLDKGSIDDIGYIF